MQYKFFMVPASSPEDGEEELNAFLRSHRVLSVRKEFVSNAGAATYWAIAVEFLDSAKSSGNSRSSRVDYREILSEPEFEVYRRLREMRKQIAESEGKPVYTIFTNSQLADMVQRKSAV